MTEFLVVGGGIGGMVAARRLALAGRSVTLFESGSSLGGTVASHTVGGLRLDAGAESFALRGDTVSSLVAELGMTNDIVSPNPQGAWLYPTTGNAVPLPKLSLLGIPGSPLARDVIAVIGIRAAVRAYLETFLPGTYGTDTTSLGELVQKRMGSAVLDNLVAPIVRGVHSIDPHDIDVDRVAPGLRTDPQDRFPRSRGDGVARTISRGLVGGRYSWGDAPHFRRARRRPRPARRRHPVGDDGH